jgi:hypothetical protein
MGRKRQDENAKPMARKLDVTFRPSATPDPERTARCLKRLRALAERILAREAREAREAKQNDAA